VHPSRGKEIADDERLEWDSKLNAELWAMQGVDASAGTAERLGIADKQHWIDPCA
jgi:hypothetical protein